MNSKNLAVASSTYLQLKDHLVHQHNEARRASLDAQHGRHHRAMIELQEHLGQHGTAAHEIEHFMGKPTKILDEPDETLSYELKRNNEHYQYPHDTKIWIYEWRGNHDYVYFLISKDGKVIQSAWYYAFE